MNYVSIGGFRIETDSFSFKEKKSRDRKDRAFTHGKVEFSATTTDGSNLFAVFESLFPLPDSIDMTITLKGEEPELIRVLRDMQPEQDIDGAWYVPIHVLQGPRMADGGWSLR